MARYTAHFLVQTLQTVAPDLAPQASAGHWQPRADIEETPDAVHIQVEAAGLDEDNLRLHFEPGHLIIEGRRERLPLDGPARCLQVEINYGAFERVLPLPPDADGENIRAHYRAGLLLITVPRRRAAAPRHIRVTVQ